MFANLLIKVATAFARWTKLTLCACLLVAFAPLSHAQAGEWTWMSGSNSIPYPTPDAQSGVYGVLGTPAPANVPGGREGSVGWSNANSGSWSGTSGNLWLFGGIGVDSTGSYRTLNDLWMYSPTNNEWTWMGGSSTIPCLSAFEACGEPGVYGVRGTPAPGNVPGGRVNSVSWTDKSGNFWLFGGYGFDITDSAGQLNDMWRYSPTSNEWTWMGGSITVVGGGDGQPGMYGFEGMPSTGNIPGAREYAASWTDGSGNLWLFGGLGADSITSSPELLNDLWEYSPATNEWAWMDGSDTHPQLRSGRFGEPGVYGVKGTPALTNMPGGRMGSVTWTDMSGNLWLFGGVGDDVNGTEGSLNDLWEYSPTTNE